MFKKDERLYGLLPCYTPMTKRGCMDPKIHAKGHVKQERDLRHAAQESPPTHTQKRNRSKRGTSRSPTAALNKSVYKAGLSRPSLGSK